MTINVERDFQLVTLEISGRLDTTTAPNLEKAVSELPSDTKELVFDMSSVEYISSAGIRVVLASLKKMNAKDGTAKIMGASDMVKEVLEMTGLYETLVF